MVSSVDSQTKTQLYCKLTKSIGCDTQPHSDIRPFMANSKTDFSAILTIHGLQFDEEQIYFISFFRLSV